MPRIDPHPQPVSVRGGADGIDAHFDSMAAAAHTFTSVAGECEQTARALRGYLLDADFGTSALLDPAGYARFEDTLLAAIDTSTGLGRVASRADQIARSVGAAVTAYRKFRVLAGQLDTGLPPWLAGIIKIPMGAGAGLDALVSTGNPATALQDSLLTDPELADTAISGDPSVLGYQLLATQLDGRGVAHDTGVARTGASAVVPRTLSDTIADLNQRNDDPRHGEIDVRILTMPDGSRRAIVDITGMKTATLGKTSDITSMTTNALAVAGKRTAYESGVFAAMRAAGVGRDDDVMLIGHSQGGMVAVNAARDAAKSGEFRVTHVVTAASPVGRTVNQVPRKIQVLALEDAHDVVPHLDDATNPARPNVTTVTSRRNTGTVLGNHGLDSDYRAIAADAQAADNPAIDHFLDTGRGYFDARTVQTHTYQVTRE